MKKQLWSWLIAAALAPGGLRTAFIVRYLMRDGAMALHTMLIMPPDIAPCRR